MTNNKTDCFNKLMAKSPIYKVKTIKQCQNKIESIVNQLKKELPLQEEFFYELLTAANEICYNAIEHGNKFSQDKVACISFCKGDDQIVFMIEDEGEGFDPKTLPAPTQPENILNPRGRGIFLARHMVDELLFCNNGRRIYLSKKIE